MEKSREVGRVLVSEATREMARPADKKEMRFESYQEELRHWTTSLIAVQGKLAALNAAEERRKIDFFTRSGGSTPSSGIRWKNIQAQEFTPERDALKLEFNEATAMVVKLKGKVKREQKVTSRELFNPDGRLNFESALLMMLSSLKKLNKEVDQLSRRVDQLVDRGWPAKEE
jgi:hypothetical protein